MIYLILVIIIVSIWDMKDLITKNKKKDMVVYIVMMLLVVAFGIFYYSNQERDNFAKITLSLIGREG